MPTLNFSGVGSGKVLPEGVYQLNIDDVQEKVSSSGNPMLLVRFKEPQENTAIFENYVLIPDSLWKLKELLTPCGIDCDGEIDFDPQSIVGMTVTAKVIQELYQGEPKNRVKKIIG
jgi:hypothetical protein